VVKRPDILLCDEPTGALDYQTSKDILSLIQEVNERWGNTVLMVTHNDAIRHMAHRVVRLRDGRIWEEQVNETQVRAEELEW
jgi:putative ABC transport system ATP-binding protein